MAEQKKKSFWDELEENAKNWWRQKKQNEAGKTAEKGVWAKTKEKGTAFFHKYIPSLMILFSGSTAASAGNVSGSVDNYKPTEKTIVIKSVNSISYNGLHFDVKNMRPEDVSMVFMSNYKFNAIYAPKGKSPTMKNATGFGPLLTRIDDLQKFINSNPEKYKELKNVMDAEGIKSDAFEQVWSATYNTLQKQQELIKDLVKFSWSKEYQPAFNKLAKIGYPKITHANYDNPDNFGYTAAVISCLGQSKRQTVDIFTEAKQRAESVLGKKASIGDFIDTSYDIRHERWGLDVRYFGKDGKGGEKAFNKKIRDLLTSRVMKLMDNEQVKIINDAVEKNYIMAGDAIKLPKEDSIFIETMKNMPEVSDNTAVWNLKVQDISEKDSIIEKNDFSVNKNGVEMLEPIVYVYDAQKLLSKFNLLDEGIDGLKKSREKLAHELSDLQSQLSEMSSDTYRIMGRKLNVNYGSFRPEMAGHIYESALDPTMKDPQNSALGLYQFNLNNTMKSLAEEFADEFPKLKIAKDNYGVKSNQYAAVWKEYSTGPKKDRFERRQLEFMWKISYQPAFDKMTKSCGLPKVTLENYNQKDLRVYVAAMMSLVNQSPRKSTVFMKQAYNRVARSLTKGKPEPNQVGLVSYDVRDEAWGRKSSKKSMAMHRRYMGGNGVIGEKELCTRMMKYDNEAPLLIAKVAETKKLMAAVDMAIANPDKMMYGNPLLQKQDVASNDAIKAMDNKIEAIQKHARNIKELRSLRRRVRRNLSKINGGEIAAVSSVQKYSDDDSYKRRGGRRRA